MGIEGPILNCGSCLRTHYDLIMLHMGLDDDAPADRISIKVEWGNKWITLIQNAKKFKSPDLMPRDENTINRQNCPAPR